MNENETVNKECCYFLWNFAPDGKIVFVRDIDKNVQLFTEEVVKQQAERRVCFYEKVGFRALK